VDGKLPFSILIMTPYMVQINFFPNFYWILKPEHTTFTQLYTWNYTQLLWWRVAFIIDRASKACSLQVNEPMYVKKLTKHVKNHNLYNKVQNCLQPYMLKAFLYTLCESKFLHTCIQSYNFFHKGLYISLEVDIVFFCIWGTYKCFYIILFLKADRIKCYANPSLIP
jgi:hypothetical protein